ncbi:histidine triad nucleotide-binding protein [Helicobacter trogontum]|uniref:HIT family protein n=1 Tax=Helicobacter trogontum TaxID=50960 RepID=A0A4U8TEZ4_9HELI|nr:histidine triad nucleotide-binding protein [Helicobacter trogontum]MCI5786071.1 histidine triad nucleotide-binding protein [Helicobacter trogontum]MDY5186138.1 histidine triad nucleotide-binding protein [Helicobacter trogontum]TLD98649.1 histidine triad nucleotide-binding protein [Helicobacter trogontum]
MAEKGIFEKIVDRELPANIVLEDDDFMAFHDIAPKAPIHVLIIPKKWVKDFNGVTPSLMGDMSAFILRVVDVLGVRESGYRLVTNIGADGGQEVPHLHFHLLAKRKLEAHFG